MTDTSPAENAPTITPDPADFPKTGIRDPGAVEPEEQEPLSRTAASRTARVILILFGVGMLALGGFVLHLEVSPKRYIGILTWFVGALILHDGVIAPAVFGVTVLSRRLQSRVPAVVIALVQGALVIGGIVLLLFVPEAIKKHIGTLSSSILPQNYTLHIAVFVVVIVVLTGLAVAIYLRVFRSRQKLRPASDQV